jgi:DNA-binding PadR family transcriptional regulator
VLVRPLWEIVRKAFGERKKTTTKKKKPEPRAEPFRARIPFSDTMEASSSSPSEGEIRQLIEGELLRTLEATGRVPNSLHFANHFQVDHAVVVSVLKKLESHGVINAVVVEVSSTELTKEGLEVVEAGSPEARLFEAIDAASGTLKADTEVPHHFINFYYFCSMISSSKHSALGVPFVDKFVGLPPMP